MQIYVQELHWATIGLKSPQHANVSYSTMTIGSVDSLTCSLTNVQFVTPKIIEKPR
jgi:hypothetical protein